MKRFTKTLVAAMMVVARKWVNRVFGVVVLGFAAWYGMLAWRGFAGGIQNANLRESSESHESFLKVARPGNLKLGGLKLPVLVDCWATWCKNCAAMDKVMEKPEVREALKPFTVIRLQAEDISELRKVKGFETIKGLPAFVIFE